ncbi:MAG TPA: glycosyltransferase family 39 protein [Terriglobales bacterium]|nr:glycosyltransferase family 39 protein [Terriglobales bacterium]
MNGRTSADASTGVSLGQADRSMRSFPETRSRNDFSILIHCALAVFLLHYFANGQYGFHRDELQTINNAQHLEWGYVEYPPLTAFVGRLELILFGVSVRGLRVFPAIVHGIVVLVTGLCAKRLGASRRAQLLAALAAAIGGQALFCGGFLSYTSLDLLWWPVVAWCVIRLIESDNPQWWLAIGAAIGAGMMTKYTMGLLVFGVTAGVIFTPARRYLRSPWMWAGAVLAFVIMLPNIVWQINHHFITLEFLSVIHSRDIRWGWTDYFLLNQLWKNANPVTLPLWLGGLWFVFGSPRGRRFRMLGWMYVVPLVILFAVRGRDYYLGSAYPMLIAAGAAYWDQWLSGRTESVWREVWRNAWITISISGITAAAISMPIAPLGSAWWRVANAINGNFHYMVGWPELAETVARVRGSLAPQEREPVGIIAADDGQAAAITVYGPRYGLPLAISGMNSNWLRGYGADPPSTVITVGFKQTFGEQNFEKCRWAAQIPMAHGITNASIDGYADVYVCHNLRYSWPDFWPRFRYYG